MTIARAHLVDPAVTRWYHCLTRCVRRAFLLGEGKHDRKGWIEHRFKELAEIFSVAVAGSAILDNHLHLLVRLDPDMARGWSDEDVVRRWGRLFPPRDKARQVAPVSEEWVQARLKDARWVATARQRLRSLSWFMKCLKEPLSRLANREEQTRGAFFEGRFKSVAILDEESLLATRAYIGLNPVAAGIAEVPEASAHTSIKQRVEHVKEQGRTEDLNAAQAGSVAGSTAAGLEEGLWLCPVEDRRRLDSARRTEKGTGVFLLTARAPGRRVSSCPDAPVRSEVVTSIHVLNRSNAGTKLFLKEEDYAAFERILDEAFLRVHCTLYPGVAGEAAMLGYTHQGYGSMAKSAE